MKSELIGTDFFPENFPPTLNSTEIANFFQTCIDVGPSYDDKNSYHASLYSASQYNSNRRDFSVIHPVVAYRMADFIERHHEKLNTYFQNRNHSYTTPILSAESQKSIEIAGIKKFEEAKYNRLSRFEFIVCTDISRFYYSLYTHVIPWAFHTKSVAKSRRSPKDQKIFFNEADKIIQSSQGGQTIGLPVGPKMSLIFSELIGHAIDNEFTKLMNSTSEKGKNIVFDFIRYNDDILIGTNSISETEIALATYRKAVRNFELDLNQAKTNIFSFDYTFDEHWKLDISQKFEFVQTSNSDSRLEYFRSILDFVFSQNIECKNQRILEFILIMLIKSRSIYEDDLWKIIESFLMRVILHGGYVIDYVVRLVLWRYKLYKDIDIKHWRELFYLVLNKSVKLGHDNEVCWIICACQILHINVPLKIGRQIVKNCGPISTVAIINCAKHNLVVWSIFKEIHYKIRDELDNGRYWPVFLELAKIDKLPENGKYSKCNIMYQMYQKRVSIYEINNMLSLLKSFDKRNFEKNENALLRQFDSFD